MNCYRCGAEMRDKIVKMAGEYAGERYEVETEAKVCSRCDFSTLHASQMDAFTTKLADAYRAKHGLLTSTQIRRVRNRLGMSQEHFARHLKVGIASLKRWELGKPQDKSSDELIRLKSDVRHAQRNLNRLRKLWKRRESGDSPAVHVAKVRRALSR